MSTAQNKTNEGNGTLMGERGGGGSERESRSLPKQVRTARLTVEVGQLCEACAMQTNGHWPGTYSCYRKAATSQVKDTSPLLFAK